MLKATSLDHFAWKDIAQIQYCMKSSRSMAQMLWATPPNMFGCMHDRSVMDNQSRGPNVFVQIIWALFLVRNSWPPPILNPKQREMGSPLMTALYWSPLHLWAPSLRKISWEWEVLQARVHQLPRTEAPQGRLFLGLWCLWLWDQWWDKEKRYRQTCS